MLFHKIQGAGGTVGGGTGNLLEINPSLNGETVWDGSAPLEFSAHGEYTITPLTDTTVTVKMWGAGGAAGFDRLQDILSTNFVGGGGGGGYSTATIILRNGSSYIFRIGEGGIRTYDTSDNGATYEAGGVNTGTPYGGSQGGGYSGIFKTSVTQGNAFLIAGGGGGGADSSFMATPFAGGGSSGQGSADEQSGGGGTQVSGGTASIYNNATAGSALLGGEGQDFRGSLGGGGGGYYGGGGGNVGGGGGGSGFVGADADISSGSTTTGSGASPANTADSDRGDAGEGGTTAISSNGQFAGTDGKIILTLVV